MLGKLLENILFDQTLIYLTENKLTTDFHHAYREGHSTCSALTQMTDVWLKEMNSKKIVGAVLLDFHAAFDVIDHKRFSSSALLWIESHLSNRTQRFSVTEASLMQVWSVVCRRAVG